MDIDTIYPGGGDGNKVFEFIHEGESEATPKAPAEKDEDGKPKNYTMEEVTKQAASETNKESQIAGDLYKEYEDFQGYYSDQFKSKLQMRLLKDAKENFVSIADQNRVMNMNLKPLDIEMDIMDDFTVLLIGRRRSGKSFMARWLMYHLRNRFPCGVVITGTKLNDFWAQYIPKEFIHDIEDMGVVLENVYKRQQFIIEHPELGIDPRCFLILDDVLKDKYKVRFSKPLSRAFTDGRHYKVFTLITSQDPRGIPPDLRENTDLCIIFRQFQRGRKESVKEDFLDYIDNKKDQLDFLWKHTGKRNSDGSEYNPEEGIRDEMILEAMKEKEKEGNKEKKEKEGVDKEEKPFSALEDAEKKKQAPPKKKLTMKEKKEDGVPQALCAIQADTTENMLDIFKIAVAEDPGPFRLGNAKYWKAMSDGRWKHLAHSFDDFIAKKADGTNPKKKPAPKKKAPTTTRKKSNGPPAKGPTPRKRKKVAQ